MIASVSKMGCVALWLCGSVALGIFPGEVSAKQSRGVVTLAEMDYRIGNVFTFTRRGFSFKNGSLTTFVKMEDTCAA
jgi:hypothetical protein